MYNYIKGYDCARARNLICQEAIDEEFEYVLMVDSDIVIPNNALVQLISHDLPIVFGWYPRKCSIIEYALDKETELFKINDSNIYEDRYLIDEVPENILLEVKGCGMGCSLIRTDILDKIKNENGMWFKFIEYNKNERLSEDLYFCDRVLRSGYKILVDTSVRCGHISKIIL